MMWKRMIKGILLILVHVGLTGLGFWFIMYRSPEILKIIFIALGCFYLISEVVHGFVQEYPFNPFKEPDQVIVKLNGKKEGK